MSRFAPFFDPPDMTGCFAADTSVGAINQDAAVHSLFFPLWMDETQSPTAHLRAGTHVSASHRFGALSDNVLGLNFRLPNGTPVRVGGRTIKNCTGFDLTHFVLNCRHSLGEVTDVVLRLRAFPGPLRWCGFRLTAEAIENFRAKLGRSPWWHVLEAVDVVAERKSLTLWIGLRGTDETHAHAQNWLKDTFDFPLPADDPGPANFSLESDASVKLLPSQGVNQARSLVTKFDGQARIHLTCGFFRWNSPHAAQATAELSLLRANCVEDGGHLHSPHLPEERPADEARWIEHLEQQWRAIAA